MKYLKYLWNMGLCGINYVEYGAMDNTIGTTANTKTFIKSKGVLTIHWGVGME